MWRITEEIWNQGRVRLIDGLIAEELIDHVELSGLEGTGRARYRASVELAKAAFPDFGIRWTSSWPTAPLRSLGGGPPEPTRVISWDSPRPGDLSTCRTSASSDSRTAKRSNAGGWRTTPR
jgi:hypothetical protein